jgi:hypothetical protein
MHMVVLAIEPHQFGFKVRANTPEYLVQVSQDFFGEHATAAFCNEDQMHMHQENAVSTMANFVIIFHRPSII